MNWIIDVSKFHRNILIALVVILQLALATYVVFSSRQEQTSNKVQPQPSPIINPDRSQSLINLYKTMLLNETEIDASTWKVSADFFYRYLKQRAEKNLRTFEANSTADDRFIAYLTQFPLVRLELKGTQVTGAGLAEIGHMPMLERLDIQGIQVTANDLKSFFEAKRLVKLDARHCGIDDDALCVLSKNKNFVVLNLESNPRISDKGIACLRDEHQLKELSLKSIPIGDGCGASLAQLVSLDDLVLVGTHISDKSLPYISQLKHLLSLDLGETKITDKGLRTFNPPMLKHLFLRDCKKLTSGAIAEFMNRHPKCDVVTGQEAGDQDWQFSGATR